ncbi:MAG: recombination regulator RecX [Saccharospirillum sp.]|nr:recombination regulator RecX [Saccharospirillum sp.]
MNDTPWNTALNLLARREHSQQELREKLRKRYPEEDVRVEDALARLVERGLQDDERFAEAFVRSRHQRGHGPVRIRFDARQKGVEAQVNAVLDESQFDWYELAAEVATRKLGTADITELKVKAKLYRFLSQRGFQPDHIRLAVETLKDE